MRQRCDRDAGPQRELTDGTNMSQPEEGFSHGWSVTVFKLYEAKIIKSVCQEQFTTHPLVC